MAIRGEETHPSEPQRATRRAPDADAHRCTRLRGLGARPCRSRRGLRGRGARRGAPPCGARRARSGPRDGTRVRGASHGASARQGARRAGPRRCGVAPSPRCTHPRDAPGSGLPAPRARSGAAARGGRQRSGLGAARTDATPGGFRQRGAASSRSVAPVIVACRCTGRAGPASLSRPGAHTHGSGIGRGRCRGTPARDLCGRTCGDVAYRSTSGFPGCGGVTAAQRAPRRHGVSGPALPFCGSGGRGRGPCGVVGAA